MHNLHLIVVRAESPEEACDIVDSRIYDWGTDNNWYEIAGCVSEDNEVFNTNEREDSRYYPEDYPTIEALNELATSWLLTPSYVDEKFRLAVKGGHKDPTAWYVAAEYCKKMYQKERLGKSSIDVLSDEFYSWTLDENGVTNMTGDYVDDDGKKYVVFLDMHS